MKAIKSNIIKLLVIWLGYFIFNVIDFGDVQMYNIFQRDSGRLFYYVFIYFLFTDTMELDFTLPRLGCYFNYVKLSLKYVVKELLPQVLLMGVGCILLSFPLNVPIDWLGAGHFLLWLVIAAFFLGMYEEIIQLSQRAKLGTLFIWMWIIACNFTSSSIFNLIAWPMTKLEFLEGKNYLILAASTILIYSFVLCVTYALVMLEKGRWGFRKRHNHSMHH